MQQEEAVDNSRVVVFGLCLFLTVLVLAGLFILLNLRPVAVGHQVFTARLSDRALASYSKAGYFSNAGWRIYDRQGRQLSDFGSSEERAFRAALNTVLRSPEVVESGTTLSWEISKLVDQSGRPLRDLPEADFTIVKYWAPSCATCQIQDARAEKALKDVLLSYTNVTVVIVNVDADVPKSVNDLANTTRN